MKKNKQTFKILQKRLIWRSWFAIYSPQILTQIITLSVKYLILGVGDLTMIFLFGLNLHFPSLSFLFLSFIFLSFFLLFLACFFNHEPTSKSHDKFLKMQFFDLPKHYELFTNNQFRKLDTYTICHSLNQKLPSGIEDSFHEIFLPSPIA